MSRVARSRGCLDTEIKSTSAFNVENFVREAAMGLRLLREAQLRSFLGPRIPNISPKTTFFHRNLEMVHNCSQK